MASDRTPKVHAKMQELDRIRSRTKRIRNEFFESRGEPAARTDPASGAISHRPQRFLKPSHIQQPDPCLDDLKYYTEVTIRPPKSEFQFNALNRNNVLAPHWNSPRPDTAQYRTSQLGDWEAVVLKPDQEAQSYSREMRVSTPKVSSSSTEDWNATMKTMFRQVDQFEVPPREYAVDPEWVSEDERIAKARATRFLQARAV
ncbi:hypothetical protein BOX15_Mlig023387g1 [Macrostomum lignano]|uniref:Uncharacterized protein n=1 Tax=Macrostomum lignano TaxID=282301 RepID=A0A267H890_9PLAT|nr:hypothetical protein BOX15_Mlig023387g1 [Macrostomum lignano]